MSKRTLERELERLSDDLLPDLSADERLSLFVAAAAEGNDHRCERLVETCPRPDRWHTDLRFVLGTVFVKQFATHAIYELHTTYLHYRRLETVYWSELQRDPVREERDAPISDERLEQAIERTETLRMLFVRLYTTYHVYRRFAEEVLAITLETWLAGHPDGSSVLAVVEDYLAESPWESTTPMWLSEKLMVDGEDRAHSELPDMDRLVDEQLDQLTTMLEGVLATVEPEEAR